MPPRQMSETEKELLSIRAGQRISVKDASSFTVSAVVMGRTLNLTGFIVIFPHRRPGHQLGIVDFQHVESWGIEPEGTHEW